MKFKKTVLITGAAGFLGQKFLTFFSKNHFVIATDKNILNLKKKIKKNKNIIPVKLDVTSESDQKKLKNFLLKNQIKSIDVLINNAAIDSKVKSNDLVANGSFKSMSLLKWKNEIDVSLTGTFLTIKYFHSLMKKKNSTSSIINIGSDLSVIVPDQDLYFKKNAIHQNKKPITYSVVKFGLIGLTKYFASELAEYNIRVNCLSPGAIKKDQGNDFLNKLKQKIPINKHLMPNNLEHYINFLASTKSSYITGQNIIVDGGRSLI